MSGQLRLSIAGALATAATALSLHTVFAGWGWLVPVMGAIVLVFGTMSAARAVRLPPVLQPLAAAVVVLLWITLLDARRVAVDDVFPGPGGWRRLRVVTRGGLHDVRQLATPVPSHRGVVLLAVLGVAAVSLVVDLTIVQLRRVALAGLPLLGLFATCAGVGHHGAGIIAFAVAATAFLWLLFVDGRERVTRWGTTVKAGSAQQRRGLWTDVGSDPSSSDTATALGRRIGGAAIGLGVIVPLFIPGLHTGIGHRHGGIGGSGDDIVTVNPIVSIASDLQSSTPRPLLSYRTTAVNPGYLQLTTLNSFRGNSFSASTLVASSANARVDGPVPGVSAPAPTATNPAVTTQVTVSPTLGVHWLPVEAQATVVRVAGSGSWLYDQASGTIFSASNSTSGLHYTATSVPVDPTPTQLADAGSPGSALATDLGLPDNLSPQVRALTHRITSKARSKYADAIAIQDYFVDSRLFTYDTSVHPNDNPDALAQFVLHSRRGFCQQYATSMAVMARIMGIPARVAVGFTRGTLQPDGSWLVTTADAHAWPELWFQGVGWVPFEPTPRADGQAVTPDYAQTATHIPSSKGAKSDGSRHNPLQTNKGTHNAGKNRQAAGGEPTSQPSSTGGGLSSGGVWGLALLVLAVLLALPASIRLVSRRRRRQAAATPELAAGAAWAELRAVALDLHAPWSDERSPRQSAARVARVVPRDRAALEALLTLALAEEESRYARQPRPVAADLWSEVDRVGAALRDRLRPAQRIRFRLFPRSLWVATRPVLTRGADLLDRLDSWISRSRRLLTTRGGPPHSAGDVPG